MGVRILYVLMLVAGANCSPVSEPSAPPTQIASTECDRQVVTRLTDEFFLSWSAHESARVLLLFGPSFDMQDGLPSGRAVLRDAVSLEGYLAERFAAGDSFSDLTFTVPDHPSAAGANATASFRRSASGVMLRGNAKFVCASGLIVSLVMSSE